MLRLSIHQVEQLERARLMWIKQEIIANLHNDYPAESRALGDADLESFVRDHMDAVRVCAITTPAHIQRFAELAFYVVHVQNDPGGPAKLAGIMLAEHSAYARLTFAAESLRDDSLP